MVAVFFGLRFFASRGRPAQRPKQAHSFVSLLEPMRATTSSAEAVFCTRAMARLPLLLGVLGHCLAETAPFQCAEGQAGGQMSCRIELGTADTVFVIPRQTVRCASEHMIDPHRYSFDLRQI